MLITDPRSIFELRKAYLCRKKKLIVELRLWTAVLMDPKLTAIIGAITIKLRVQNMYSKVCVCCHLLHKRPTTVTASLGRISVGI